MTPRSVDDYLTQLGDALRTRGSARRRLLRECRDHLTEAAAERGEASAIRAFGPPTRLAETFDAEVATTRAVHATFLTLAAVVLTGCSTLALIHAAAATAAAPAWWAISFFVSAQLAAVSAGIALAQALVGRSAGLSPAQIRLLARRDICALAAAGMTLFSAGAALPGHGSASLILAGTAVACVALAGVLRVRSAAGRLRGADANEVRQPLSDIARLLRIHEPQVDPHHLLAGVMVLAAAAAFLRQSVEHATAGPSLVAAGIEAAAVAACFFVLGPALGIRRRPTRAARERPTGR